MDELPLEVVGLFVVVDEFRAKERRASMRVRAFELETLGLDASVGATREAWVQPLSPLAPSLADERG